MTTDANLQPALTAKEWALHLKREPFTVLSTVDLIASSSDSGERHAAAAVALFGQPFGFTREDVKLLREVMESSNSVYPLELSADEETRLVSLTERIVALLPPE